MKHNQILRRGLSILLSLVLCLSLLPATALAEGTESVTICGTTLEEGKAYVPSAGGGIAEKTEETAYLEYSSGTLTVHGSVTVALPASSTANVLKLESSELTISCPEGSSLTLDGQNSTAAAVSLQSSTLTLTGAGDVTIQGSATAVSGGTLKAESYSGDLAISAAGNSATVNNTVLNLDTTGNISITGSMPVAGGLLTVTNAADVTITGSVGNLLPDGSVITDTGSISIESESNMVVNGLTVNNAEKVTLTGDTTGPVAMSVTLNNCESWDIINKNQTSAAPLAINITVDGTPYGNCYGVTVTDDDNGTASASLPVASAGTNITLSATPDRGYRFKEWQVAPDTVTINDNQFTMPGANVTVQAVFESIPSVDVAIDEANFPDETFRKYVSDNFDTDTEKGVLSPAEIEAVTSIVCPNMGITDLKGIEHFTELTILSCSQNQLKELDVSKNTKLYGLNCSENQLKALDVSKNAELVVLTCSKNQLETLSVSGNAKLNSLNCSENQLKKINVSGNTALETLECSDNMLTALVVSNNTALKVLRCAKNQLTTLNVAKNSILNTLDCSGNQLTALSVSSNAELNSLDCSENQLETLDVSSSTSLDQLRCSNNRLKVLDVSKNTGLRLLYCKENQLTSLDLSENGKITRCYAENNSYEIELTSGRTFDLSTLPGKFEVGKASGWTDSSVSGNTLTVNDGATKVTYIYNCENSITAKFTLTVKSGSGVANEVAIDEANFPDEKFRQYVSVYTDKDGNGALSTDEIAQAEKIYCSNRGIKDFTGIEHFTALTELYCDKNQLIALDVSSNTALEYLECSESQLTTLNIGSNTKLKSLICSKNQLTSLDVSGNTALKDLVCSENRLATPNLSINPALENLDCSKNQLTGLDLSGNAALKNLDCSGNQLTTLGFSDGAVLEKLICSDNRLATLNVSGSAKLTELHCGQNKLASLDVSKNTALEKLDCSGNQLTTLDVSSNTALTGLDCSKNNLTSLNLTGTQVNILYADDNTYPIKLTSGRTFDLSSLPGKFEVGNAGGWNGGSVSGNILTVNADATEVTYTYDCGHNNTETFTLNFFVDVPADAYYYDAVLWAAENGITGGVDDTHFAPNAPCTRAQIVTFLWRAAGSPEPETVSSFADVPADAYYAKAVAWAVENGITAGTGDGMFSPDATCTRAQAMAFIWRSQKSVAADGANPFTDVAADAYYADAVLWAVENGVTNGTSDTTFSPNTNCIRAHIVTFLYRCLGEE